MTGHELSDGAAPAAGPAALLPRLPDPALVLLVGPSGAGKSHFARQRFAASSVLSTDALRASIADDAADQTASADAFALLYRLVSMRLSRQRQTVIDATNVHPQERSPLLALARAHGVPAVALIFDLPLEACLARNAARPDRQVPEAVVARQWHALAVSRDGLPDEGFAAIHVLPSGLILSRP